MPTRLEDLSTRQVKFAADVKAVAAELMDLYEQNDVSKLQPSSEPTLAELESLFELLQSEITSSKAQRELDAVMALRCRNGDSDAVLGSVWEASRNAEEILRSNEGELREQLEEQVLSGEHPLCKLLSFLRERDTMDGDLWKQLMMSVMEDFGPEVAMNASNGGIILADEVSEAPVIPAPAEMDAADPDEPVNLLSAELDDDAPMPEALEPVTPEPAEEEPAKEAPEPVETEPVVPEPVEPEPVASVPTNGEAALAAEPESPPSTEEAPDTPAENKEPEQGNGWDVEEAEELEEHPQRVTADLTPPPLDPFSVDVHGIAGSLSDAAKWKQETSLQEAKDETKEVQSVAEAGPSREKPRGPVHWTLAPQMRGTVVLSAWDAGFELDPDLHEDAGGDRSTTPSAAIAQEILQEGERRRQDMLDLIWSLVKDGRFAVAYHLATLVMAAPPEGPYVSPGVIAARYLAQELRSAEEEDDDDSNDLEDEIAGALRSIFSCPLEVLLHGSRDQDSRRATLLLLLAGVLRPALMLAGRGDLIRVMRQISSLEGEGLPPGFEADADWQMENLVETTELCITVLDYCRENTPLDPMMLRRAKSMENWQTERLALVKEAREWLTRSERFKIPAVPAQNVWLKWVHKDGEVARLLAPITEDDTSAKPKPLPSKYQNQISEFTNGKSFNSLVKKTDRKDPKRGNRKLVGRSVKSLKGNAQQAVKMAKQWVALHKRRPDKPVDPALVAVIADLREKVNEQGAACLEELNALAAESDSMAIPAAVMQLIVAVDDLKDILDANSELEVVEADSRDLFGGPLLRSTTLDLDDEWRPTPQVSSGTLDALLSLAAEESADWSAIYATHAKRKNHDATGRVLDYLQRAPQHYLVDLEELEAERLEAIGHCRTELEGKVRESQTQVEQAVALGWLRDKRFECAATLDRLNDELSRETLLDFGKAEQALKEIGVLIAAQRDEERRRIHEQLRAAGIGDGHPSYELLQDALDEDNFLTALEYLSIIREGGGDPAAELQAPGVRQVLPPTSQRHLGQLAADPQAGHSGPAARVRRHEGDVTKHQGVLPGELRRPLVAGAQPRRGDAVSLVAARGRPARQRGRQAGRDLRVEQPRPRGARDNAAHPGQRHRNPGGDQGRQRAQDVPGPGVRIHRHQGTAGEETGRRPGSPLPALPLSGQAQLRGHVQRHR